MGKILGLDYGAKRIGLAISDEAGALVFPRPAMLNEGEKKFFTELQQYAAAEGVERIVVGLPLTLRGEQGPQATAVKDIMSKFEEVSSLPVEFEDERLSSAFADRYVNDSSFSRDSLAAAAILESFLARRKSG